MGRYRVFPARNRVPVAEPSSLKLLCTQQTTVFSEKVDHECTKGCVMTLLVLDHFWGVLFYRSTFVRGHASVWPRLQRPPATDIFKERGCTGVFVVLYHVLPMLFTVRD